MRSKWHQVKWHQVKIMNLDISHNCLQVRLLSGEMLTLYNSYKNEILKIIVLG